ncbi:pseudouridine synthase [Reinekea sp.]|jgi:16S rRNA pseudouridine516 synthase|uniref:pseudouridine synthase n=1 Tax=Reinekea sp. TaxID=1970455 RepID=UPI003988C4A4
MNSKRFRLDRYLSQRLQRSKKQVQRLLAARVVLVDGTAINDPQHPIDEFSHIVCDGKILQQRQRRYVMLHKPAGVVSATVDEQATALDLIDKPYKAELHIAGRLDKNSTGLLLLTNDGRWSQLLSDAATGFEKAYQVTVRDPISDDCVQAFEQGIYFEYENLTTAPAELNRLSACHAQVKLTEGRYHQIKRMFGRFRNPVLSIHRTAIGPIKLDPSLSPGDYRVLTDQEVSFVRD